MLVHIPLEHVEGPRITYRRGSATCFFLLPLADWGENYSDAFPAASPTEMYPSVAQAFGSIPLGCGIFEGIIRPKIIFHEVSYQGPPVAYTFGA